MEQHLIVAVKAIIPLFLLIGVGIFVRWQKMLTDTELKHPCCSSHRFCCVDWLSVSQT